MVCAGITYNAGTNRITVEYNAGDGAHGASFTNPYTFEDIYDTDQANGWGVTQIQNNATYWKQTFIDAGLTITGIDTYFKAYREAAIVCDTAQSTNYNVLDGTANLYIEQCSLSTGAGTVLYQRIYFDSHITGSSITFKNFCLLAGETFSVWGANSTVEDCLLMNIKNHYYRYNPTISNVIIVGGNYGFTPRSEFTKAENITVIGCTRGILAGYGSFTLTGFRPIDCTHDLWIMPDFHDRVVNLIDSYIDTSKVYFHNLGGDIDCNTYLKTTFNAEIEDSSGGTLTIYDKDSSIVYDEVLASDNMTEQKITYRHYEYIIVGGVATTQDTNIKEPFKLKVTKPGYRTLEIPDITVTPGQPTTIYGKMEYPTYVDNYIDVEIADAMTVELTPQIDLEVELND